jgi:hypothetical protein
VAVFGKVANLSTVKPRLLGALALIVLLYWGVCHVAKLCLHGIGVGIVVLVLMAIVWCPGAG